MGMNDKTLSAYQGRGWQPRTPDMNAELAMGAAPRVNSEYKRLTAVLLYCPGAELRDIADPNAVQHLAKIDHVKIRREFAGLAAAYRKCGVKVHMMGARTPFSPEKPDKHNLMFVRDLFVNTLCGAVVARMASMVRTGEEKYAVYALAGLDIPIARTVTGRGFFEGADALWLDERTMLCGTGNRTNREGCDQLRQTLALQGVEVLETRLPGGVQHLLGLLQIVDRRLALLRTGKAPAALKALLKKKCFTIIPVPESPEVTRRQGMNIVTAAPRRVIMPSGCPRLKALYIRAGLSVAGEVAISQLANGAGGIACATGIVAREL